MVHNKWTELTITERITLWGRISHLLTSDEQSFIALDSMVRSADQKGLFNDIIINPEREPLNHGNE
jgi:hypothetical protein